MIELIRSSSCESLACRRFAGTATRVRERQLVRLVDWPPMSGALTPPEACLHWFSVVGVLIRGIELPQRSVYWETAVPRRRLPSSWGSVEGTSATAGQKEQPFQARNLLAIGSEWERELQDGEWT